MEPTKEDIVQHEPKPNESEHHSDTPKAEPELKTEETSIEMTGAKKKKKKSSKPKSKRGKNKPTGFEEFYVDAPMTPAEHTEELELYHTSRPILHRIEEAILRYQKNRRIVTERREVFMKYLSYGGVNVSQKIFAGVDDREMQEMDSEQIMLFRGQTSIEEDRSEQPIDFDAVVKGYLTSYFPYFFNPETEEMIHLATVTIRNFLSYLLYHDVCPEYKENIDQARTSCDIATKELWNNQQFTAKGPGDFNMGCSTLFGGVFFDMYVEDDQWENAKDPTVKMTYTVARKVVKFALAGAGSDVQAIRFQELANRNMLRAMRIEDIDGFEVIAVFPPDPDVREFYKRHASDLRPIGKMVGKAYRDPGKPGFDIPAGERADWEENGGSRQEFEFFLEEELLKFCYPGMKVMTSVFELNCGMHFFDEVFTAYSSLYTVLANDLMIGWKKPKNKMGDEGEDAESDGEGKKAA